MKQALQKMNENKDKNKTESCSFFCLSYESLGTQDVSFVFVGDRKQPSWVFIQLNPLFGPTVNMQKPGRASPSSKMYLLPGAKKTGELEEEEEEWDAKVQSGGGENRESHSERFMSQ